MGCAPAEPHTSLLFKSPDGGIDLCSEANNMKDFLPANESPFDRVYRRERL
jgi:hypothetical protein